MDIIQGTRKSPRRVLLYGTHGIGKSTWAASSPKPLVLATEDGLNDIGVDRTPVLGDFGEVNEWLSWVIQQQHEYKTLVVDTADWLERLIHQAVALKKGKTSIEEIAYGKGYLLALDAWDFILNTLDHIRSEKHMAIVLLAHAKIEKFQDPTTDSYDRYSPDLHKTISPRLQEWCDEVLFATYRVRTVKQDEGFGRERTRVVGNSERVVYTCEMPTHLAKRRTVLPDELPLDFAAYAKHLSNSKGNINGVVVDGSSKRKGSKTDGEG